MDTDTSLRAALLGLLEYEGGECQSIRESCHCAASNDRIISQARSRGIEFTPDELRRIGRVERTDVTHDYTVPALTLKTADLISDRWPQMSARVAEAGKAQAEYLAQLVARVV